MSTIASLWDDVTRANLEKIVLIYSGQRLTYGVVDHSIRSLSANLFYRGGIRSGDVVALLAPNCSEFVISYFSIIRIGAIVQPIDERLSSDEICMLLRDSAAEFLIVHGSLWPKLEKIMEQIPTVRGLLGIQMMSNSVQHFEDWISDATGDPPVPSIKPDAVAELMYTSGTSGKPKAVMRSHRNVGAAAQNARRGFGYRSDDVIAIVMPMSHSSALTSQMVPLLEVGGTLVLLDRFEVRGLLDVIASEKVSCLRAVPAILQLLLSQPSFCAKELPSLRLLINSSATIRPDTYLEVKNRFSGIEVLNSYGLTEASTCTILPDSMALTRPDSIGYPIDGVEMCVLDGDGEPASDGEKGELCVRGEHVFVGYRNHPLETQAVFHNGWFRTGDLGHRDGDGYYYLFGRKQEMINCGGRKYSPVEVENCILKLPSVADVGVVRAPHAVLGEVAKAYIVLQNGTKLKSKEVINHCARNLPSYKIPFFVEIVPELPKNAVGKVLRWKLKEGACV
jgi:long-chain acyl-CoA synthetase